MSRVDSAAVNQCTLNAVRPGQTFSRTDSGVPGAQRRPCHLGDQQDRLRRRHLLTPDPRIHVGRPQWATPGPRRLPAPACSPPGVPLRASALCDTANPVGWVDVSAHRVTKPPRLTGGGLELGLLHGAAALVAFILLPSAASGEVRRSRSRPRLWRHTSGDTGTRAVPRCFG